jgi:hypothetical protein
MSPTVQSLLDRAHAQTIDHSELLNTLPYFGLPGPPSRNIRLLLLFMH